MKKRVLLSVFLTAGVVLSGVAAAQEKTEAAAAKSDLPAEAVQRQPDEQKPVSVEGGKGLGMSILGNQEAPKALVIIPWKRSEPGSALEVSTMLDDSRQPVDKDVFMRMLNYYAMRSEERAGSTPAKTNAPQPDAAAQRRQ